MKILPLWLSLWLRPVNNSILSWIFSLHRRIKPSNFWSFQKNLFPNRLRNVAFNMRRLGLDPQVRLRIRFRRSATIRSSGTSVLFVSIRSVSWKVSRLVFRRFSLQRFSEIIWSLLPVFRRKFRDLSGRWRTLVAFEIVAVQHRRSGQFAVTGRRPKLASWRSADVKKQIFLRNFFFSFNFSRRSSRTFVDFDFFRRQNDRNFARRVDERRCRSSHKFVVASTKMFSVASLVDVIEGQCASIESSVVVVVFRRKKVFFFFRSRGVQAWSSGHWLCHGGVDNLLETCWFVQNKIFNFN